MIAIIVNIIINILMCFYSIGPEELSEKNNILEMSELEETVNLPLTKILDDILSDSNASDQNNKNIYVFGITRFNQGIRVNVHKEARGKINESLNPLGYLQHDNKVIIVKAEDWLIEEGFIRFQEMPDKLTVMTEFRHPGIIYDPDSWSYCVREGNFSRHVDGIGWVWTLCNEETDRSTLHRFLIEAPKRTKNKSSR